jgi:transcriptional repressor NrdR
MVVKKDGRREEFSRDKLFVGLRKACDKRPIDPEALTIVMDEIEAELNSRPGNDVTTAEIGEMAMARLRALDHIAYIRYASAHREFADVEWMREELDNLAAASSAQRASRDQLPLFSREEMEQLFQSPRVDTRETQRTRSY